MQAVRPTKRVVNLLILAAFLAAPPPGHTSGSFAAISGKVRDSLGTPLSGALVVIVAANPLMPERMAWTDKRGLFSVPNLFAGEYSVKITMPRFLPSLKSGILLNAGGSAMLTVSLQNALDIVGRVITRDRAPSDDIVWTMRSSRSTQPPLRLVESAARDSGAKDPVGPSDYSGYLQIYSKSVDISSGIQEGVGSQFSVTMPLAEDSSVTVAGLYSELPSQPRGFGASYEFKPSERHRKAVGFNMRQGALIGNALNSGVREVQLQYTEDLQWSDHLVISYGAEVGRSDATSNRNYLRPRLAVSWVPEARTAVTVGATTQAPNSVEDPIRGKEYFDRTAYIPPSLEQYSHVEGIFSRTLAENLEFSAAVFRDRTETQSLFLTTPEGKRELLVFETGRQPVEGFRLHVNRGFRGFEGGLGYTNTGGLIFTNRDDGSVLEGHSKLSEQRIHMVTARFKADFEATQSELTAVYRWISEFSLTRLDPYQRNLEYNDPSLSLTFAQNLPTWRVLPGRVQAIVDARNLFEHTYSAKGTRATQYPRLVKGGINIKF